MKPTKRLPARLAVADELTGSKSGFIWIKRGFFNIANGDMIQYKTVQSIEKGLGILEILPDDPEEGLGITEIAERLSVPKSTTHRIISALVHRGFVLQDDG